ncbi:MAG: hypothetical protein ACYC1C_04385 [Chloroflexota bacterium]
MPLGEGAIYRVYIQEQVDRRWQGWFEGLSIQASDDGSTVIEGTVTDQAALHGLLNRVRDLGLTLLSVERVDQ